MAVVRLAYKLTGNINYIDLAKGLSLFERRLIRQKQVFTVLGGMLVDNKPADEVVGCKIKVSTAPNNYYTRNAVTRCFNAWKSMRKRELERSLSDESLPVPTAKYADFKIWLDQSATGYRNPIDADSHEYGAQEWSQSDLTNEKGTTQEVHIVGPHSTGRYSAVQGWLETRSRPRVTSPEMPDLNSDGTPDVEQDFLVTLYEDLNETSARLEDIAEENNNSPYPLNELITTHQPYSAAQPNNLQLQCIVHSDVNEVNQAVPGFQALCGLIRVDVEGGSDPILLIDVETKGWSF